MIDTSIKGLQEAQAAVLRTLAALKPEGALGQAIKYATAAAHRFATANTVVDTGTWRAAQRPEVKGIHGRVYLDPTAQNPQGHGFAAVYGPALERAKGGRYAVYARTVNEAGPGIVAQAGATLYRRLP